MRVITGTARGRRLEELPGLDTRPTTSRVKEGLFSAIQFDIEGRRALDLFAGTGQLGIEAMSRGAAWCDFVDSNPAAMKIVRRNAEKYGLVFLDPPYASGDLEKALERIAAIDIVAGNGIIVCESPAESTLPGLPEPYEKGREYRYGKTKVTLYRRKA